MATARRRRGLLTAKFLREVRAEEMSDWFEVDDDGVADPARRAGLWRDLAAGLLCDYEGSCKALLVACAGRLGGKSGLLECLGRYEAFSDPLAKKAFLFAKIAARRGWWEVADPESWQVSADSVLMRIALRSGLVEPGPLAQVRSATRERMHEWPGIAA